MVNLRSLNIAGTKVAGPGLDHLKGLTNLRSLNLVDTRVTDSGLVYLEGLTGLEDLGLSGEITDAGLAHLKGLTKMNDLSLYSTQVTGRWTGAPEGPPSSGAWTWTRRPSTTPA